MSHHHHQAVDNLINVFARASHNLNVVHSKLDKEFQQIYPDNANPMKLIQRIKKLQEDVTVPKDQCLELLSAKQDLIDRAQTTLVGNYNLIQKMNASESTNGDADDALVDFNQSERQRRQIKKTLISYFSQLLFITIEDVHVHGYVQTYTIETVLQIFVSKITV